MNNTDKLVYRSYNNGRWYVVIRRNLGEKLWYCGYATINKQEAKNGDVIDVTYTGKAGDVGLAGIFDPDQLVAGVDTADPATNWMTIADVINLLEMAVSRIEENSKEE